MTPRQAALLKFIASYQERKGASPSFSEMRAAMGLRSKCGVHQRLGQLQRRGYIARTPGVHREIKILRVAGEGEGRMIWGCTHCVVDRVGIKSRVIRSEELHALTVTVEGAKRPSCRVCKQPMTRLTWMGPIKSKPKEQQPDAHAPA